MKLDDVCLFDRYICMLRPSCKQKAAGRSLRQADATLVYYVEIQRQSHIYYSNIHSKTVSSDCCLQSSLQMYLIIYILIYLLIIKTCNSQ